MAGEKIARWHDWGLKLLHDDSLQTNPEGPCLDIVLIHGLGGHRETTWAAENGFIWAKGILPRFIPNLRVFTFGYSGTPKSTCNNATVLSIAMDLLGLLSDERDQPHLKHRPLIWAGHNLGGNIIKEALVMGSSRANGDYYDIYYSTVGVLFFATPHKGLNAKTFLMANKHQRVRFSNNPPSPLLNEMNQNDSRISDLLTRFRGVTTNGIGFVSLLEGALVPGLSEVVVDETSGTLSWPTEKIRKLDTADHIQICKFSNTMNNDLAVLARQIRDIVTTSRKATTYLDKNRVALERLGIFKMQPNTRPVQPAEGTCESIAKQCFDKWPVGAQGNFSSLWVRGPKGCGKAHLARHMADKWKKEIYDRLHGPQRLAIIAHCSVNDIVTHYRTASSVVLCWLRQILDADPELIRHLRNRFDKEAAGDPVSSVCDWEEDHIVDLWQDVISAVAQEVGFLVFIADGVDKCDVPQALPNLVKWVAKAAEKAATIPSGAQFQVLVFSNDTEKLRSLNHSPVHQLTPESFLLDIECAVRDRVNETLRHYAGGGELHGDQGQQYDGVIQQDREAGGGTGSELEALLWKTIRGGEEKTHLWATILMGEIKAANFSDKASLVEFLEFLNNSPDGGKLDALYGAIVRRISSGHELNRHSFNVLFLVMHSIGVMTEQEVQEGCGMLDAAEFGGTGSGGRFVQRHIQQADMERTPLDYNTFRRALGNCGGLVKVWSRGLCLIHDSFRDYFTTCANRVVHQDYCCSPETAAGVIACLFVDYLLLPRFENAGPPAAEQESRQWENKVHNRVQENKLVRYASLRWIEHLQRSGSVFEPRHTSHEESSQMRRLLDPGKGYMKSWTEVLWYWTKSAEGAPYPKERFPWELFAWKNFKRHWQSEQELPSPRFPPPSFGGPDRGQPRTDSGYPSLEQPGSGHSDIEHPTLEQPPSERRNEGEGSQEAWWRKKRVWLAVFALVIIIISGTVGGILGSQRASRNDAGQQPRVGS